MSDVTQAVRAFNRRWTRLVGLLDEGLLETEHTLPEARVLFELARTGSGERLHLRESLGLDDSYLTRLLTRLTERGLVASAPSASDGRRRSVALTGRGRQAFETLDARSEARTDALLAPLTEDGRRALVEAFCFVSQLTDPGSMPREVRLRGVRPGDLGWVVQRHGAIYADEHGFDASFEALVARIVADWQTGRDPVRESAWIAEVDGVRAGSVFCCASDDAAVAKLRILLVEPWARGAGVGSTLIDACTGFAREAGYARMELWTNDTLVAARRLYERTGFALVDETPHRSFGVDLVGQTWALDLGGAASTARSLPG